MPAAVVGSVLIRALPISPKMCQCDSVPKASRTPDSLAEAGKLFLKHTTFHGLRHVFLSGSYPRKLAWLLTFLAALALLFTWSSNRVRYLLSSPVHTKAHMVNAKRLVFPAVTICNQNLLIPRRMKKPDIFSAGRWLGLLGRNWQVSPSARDALTPGTDHDSSSSSNEPPWSPISRILDFNHFLPPPLESQPSMRQLLDRLGHQMEEMLLYCRFQGELCGPRNFSTIFTRYGKCYTFNSGQDNRPLLVTMRGGMGNGLELMLDIQQDEYLPVWGETDETSYEAGIKVQIHTQDEPPFIDQLGFGVAPGFQTFVSCQEQRLTYLPPPWGDCKSTPMDSDFFSSYSLTSGLPFMTGGPLPGGDLQLRLVHMPGIHDSVILSDAIGIHDSVILSDAIGIHDSVILSVTIGIHDSVILSVTIGIHDSVILSVTIGIHDSVILSDAIGIHDSVILSDAIGIHDSVILSDAIGIHDSVILSDAIGIHDSGIQQNS
ncbi:unnamed protein product [Coregonus sp. 'balchen']|nr:unnamed protein product [Coregonus sp. 'balchen']